jgi:hypothetical protein
MSEDPSKNGYRQVNDIVVAAFLTVTGHPLRGVKKNGGRGLFLFDSSPAVEAAMLNFYNRHATVEPLGFHEAIRYLKGATIA